MKDQVDNLNKKDIYLAVTINGLIDILERQKAIEKVASGEVSILYISPESLRTPSIEYLLNKRKVVRFVIDEAHCFSTWGQDFRQDYLYIGEFIKEYQERKNLIKNIPISCFTATAKVQVIKDIENYFSEKLNVSFEKFLSSGKRDNLEYEVYATNKETKNTKLLEILNDDLGPTIIYVSRTKKTVELAESLSNKGFPSTYFHGKLDNKTKIDNQDAFIRGDYNIIVATSAFGMGVDKDNVTTVIHYDISDSIENYVQEAGRAGRNEKLSAKCHILFDEEDLDSHFALLVQNKVNINEVKQVWKAIKTLSKGKTIINKSAYEIAKASGWDVEDKDFTNKIATSIMSLEDAGLVKRGKNSTKIFADSLSVGSVIKAKQIIYNDMEIEDAKKEKLSKLVSRLITKRSTTSSSKDESIARTDVLSEQLGIPEKELYELIDILRGKGILEKAKDIKATIERTNKSMFLKNCKLQEYILKSLDDNIETYSIKALNTDAINNEIDSTTKDINILLNYLNTQKIISVKKDFNSYVRIIKLKKDNEIAEYISKQKVLSELILDYLKNIAEKGEDDINKVVFSTHELKDYCFNNKGMFIENVTITDIEDVLLYLSRIGAIAIDGGFFVMYNTMSIKKLTDNSIQYKKSDYKKLEDFYNNKIQQIHIVGEFAQKMINSNEEAMSFVDDYFESDYQEFLDEYFGKSRMKELRRTITNSKYEKLFNDLSEKQREIIEDDKSSNITVMAGPGSGKTKLLVSKLASLLRLEDVKTEQLLMLAFSRASVTEFKIRLKDLIGVRANFVDIKTFYSYCFDVLGLVGDLKGTENILKEAVEKIRGNEIEESKITKTTLVIDEAQDMRDEEYEIIKALSEYNPDLKIIAVGDDNQNIYSFRGSNSNYFKNIGERENSTEYELLTNYRSKNKIVDFMNMYAFNIENRFKTSDLVAYQKDCGLVKIVEHTSDNLTIPIVNDVVSQLKNGIKGSTCILTKTNEEALKVYSLLAKNKIPTKLIQDFKDFKVWGLREIRKIVNTFENAVADALISENLWCQVVANVKDKCKDEHHKELLLSIMDKFSQINSKYKYLEDFKNFLKESTLVDFINIKNDVIYVSTVHKSKGKEFDNVYIMLQNHTPKNDEEHRLIYVGISRAKSMLSIHTNTNYLREIDLKYIDYEYDRKKYSDIDDISIQLEHKDINLNTCINNKEFINAVETGTMIDVNREGILDSKGDYIQKFSRKFIKELNDKLSKGYKLEYAYCKYIVNWIDKTTNEETEVILPVIHLKKV